MGSDVSALAFLDTETTGLHPDDHEVWEVGLVLRDDGREREFRWLLPVDLKRADPVALEIGRFNERYQFDEVQQDLQEWCAEFSDLTAGAHLVGAVISFDEERLRRLLWRHNFEPEWHYHLVDVEGMVAGALGIQPPWKSDDLAAAVGVTLDESERHTALGDARWAMRIYDAVISRAGVPVPEERTEGDG